MFCSNCGAKNEDRVKFCNQCGACLETINNANEVSSQVTKRICLVCKGEGEKINKVHLLGSLFLGLIVFPIVAFSTGGVTLIGSFAIIFWGTRKKTCKTCGGIGYLIL